jgi:hypothetical protein
MRHVILECIFYALELCFLFFQGQYVLGIRELVLQFEMRIEKYFGMRFSKINK